MAFSPKPEIINEIEARRKWSYPRIMYRKNIFHQIKGNVKNFLDLPTQDSSHSLSRYLQSIFQESEPWPQEKSSPLRVQVCPIFLSRDFLFAGRSVPDRLHGPKMVFPRYETGGLRKQRVKKNKENCEEEREKRQWKDAKNRTKRGSSLRVLWKAQDALI